MKRPCNLDSGDPCRNDGLIQQYWDSAVPVGHLAALTQQSSRFDGCFSVFADGSSELDGRSVAIDEQSSVIDTHSSAFDEQSPIIDTHSSAIDEQSSIADTAYQSLMSTHQSLIRTPQPSMSTHQSLIRTPQPSMSAHQSSIRTPQSSMSAHQSSILTPQPLMSNHQPLLNTRLTWRKLGKPQETHPERADHCRASGDYVDQRQVQWHRNLGGPGRWQWLRLARRQQRTQHHRPRFLRNQRHMVV